MKLQPPGFAGVAEVVPINGAQGTIIEERLAVQVSSNFNISTR